MSMIPWVFVDSGARPGAWHMACDEGLARRMQNAPDMPAVLRLYRWHPWAVSLGHHQAESALDAARCAREGIDIVRRPTGGRAILHAEELTYCVVMPSGGRSVLEVYNHISRALVRGLTLFGVDTQLQKSQPDFRAEYRKSSSVPCFASSARYEIEWQGRKLVGSAQRRFGGGQRDVVLQHGSILCGPAHRRLEELLVVDHPAAREEVRDVLLHHTVDLAEILGGPPDIAALADAVRRGFEQEWSMTFGTADSVVQELETSHG